MDSMKTYNTREIKKLSPIIIFKFILSILSLILLSIVLFYLINSMGDIFGPDEDITLEIILVSVSIGIILLLSIAEVLTVKEYMGYFVKKPFLKKGKSYLNLDDIFENENRINIIREILNNPGIHNNELMRNCSLEKGQLQWHLNVLLKHRIIKKEKYGQYKIYFPITSSIETIEAFKNLPTKSKTTSKILELIQNNPGISASEISNHIELAPNTIKYHIDKLTQNDLIQLKKAGRRKELYPKI